MGCPEPSDLVKTVVANVRILRQQQGITASAMAEQMASRGVHMKQSVIVNLEHARRSNITVDELWAFADLFGKTIDQLTTPLCVTCLGCPPRGFTCDTCGTSCHTSSRTTRDGS